MLAERLEDILLALRPARSFFPTPRLSDASYWQNLPGAKRNMALSQAERALHLPVPALMYCDAAGVYQGGVERYVAARDARRASIKDLTIGYLIERDDRYIARVADLVYLVAAEADWSAGGLCPGEDVLDEQAVDTAEALAASGYLLDRELLPDAVRGAFQFAQEAVKRRVVLPLYDEAQGLSRMPLKHLSIEGLERLLFVALLERDDRVRWLCVREVLLALDGWLDRQSPDGGTLKPIAHRVGEIAAFSACLRVLSRATGSEVDLRDEQRYLNLVRLPSLLHVDEGRFFDPDSGRLTDSIDAEDLFFAGRTARDDAVAGLAAHIGRRPRGPSFSNGADRRPLFRRVEELLMSNAMDRTTGRVHSHRAVSLQSISHLVKRRGGLYVHLTGGRPGRVGDLMMLNEGRTILESPWPHAGNVPLIDGLAQSAEGIPATDAECVEDGEYALLSMNIARAYAPSLNLHSWQRSVMFLPRDPAIRLVDVFEFDGAARTVEFAFVFRSQPAMKERSVYAAGASIEWEEGLDASLHRVDGDEAPYYRLLLRTGEPTREGQYTFIIHFEQ